MLYDRKKTIFLLGGHDLEMSEIKRILLEEGFEEGKNLFDKNLKWGAKLSCYSDELKRFSEHCIYGIELIEDITPPENYVRIDHHNDYAGKEASLLQVLKLLGKEATREQMLIAKNDEGHIDAMRCFGASTEEIQAIRRKDREVQGVSQSDETQAEKELTQVKHENGIYIVHTSLTHFSPLVDRFEKRPFIVYSDKEVMFYGDVGRLREKYEENIKKGEAFHGRGYFGFDTDYVQKYGNEKIVKEILNLHKERLFSYHHFMFPFRFDYLIKKMTDKHQYYMKHSFDERVKIDTKMKEELENDGWEYQKFEIKNHLDYNEIVYFHDFVKDALFNTSDFQPGATSYFFEKSVPADSTFKIKIKGINEPYELHLAGITLRLFDTGVGILSFELENRLYSDREDIFKINDYGRRLYPQFVGDGFDVEKTKEAFLAEYIEVNGIKEDFQEKSHEIRLARYIPEILGKTFTTEKDKDNKYYLQPSIDDRMFVLCWYGNDAFSECVKENIYHDDWYRYVYVDGGEKTVQDDQMCKKLIDEATYTRWKNYGTFYGVTRYSFVCLSQNSGYTQNVLPLPHMKTMYFQMATLLLAQRASLLRFSDEITAISDIRDEEPTAEKISILYKNYLRFINKLYFKEVTAQDQGIELYDKAIERLNIKRDVDDLRQEIATLNSYAFLEQEKEEKQQMNKLTKLGTFLLPPSLIAGIFGMNVFGKGSIDITNLKWLVGVIALLLVSPFIVKLFIKDKNGAK